LKLYFLKLYLSRLASFFLTVLSLSDLTLTA
jgi:hypothetical protein